MSTSTTTPTNTTWSCAQCSATFDKSKLLERHALQTSHKAYKCLKCPKVFGKRTALIRHKTIHSDVKSHVCRVCEKAFYRKDHCAEHEEVCTHRLAVETKARLSASLAESIGSAIDSRGSTTGTISPREIAVDQAFEPGNNRIRHCQASGDGDTLETPLSEVRQRPSSAQHLADSERSNQQSTIHENVPLPKQQGRVSGGALPSGLDALLAGRPEAIAGLRQYHDSPSYIPPPELRIEVGPSDPAGQQGVPAAGRMVLQQSGPGNAPGAELSRKRRRSESVDRLSEHNADQDPRSARRNAASDRSSLQTNVFEQSGLSEPHGRPLDPDSSRDLAIEPYSSWSDLYQSYASSGFDWNVVHSWTPTVTQVPSKSTSRGPTAARLPDMGTYTCTYHGCTQRFDNASSLQRHKRDFHRTPLLEDGSGKSTGPPAIRIDLTPPVSGDQLADRRSSPFSAHTQAESPQPSATGHGNGYVSMAFWRLSPREVRALQGSLEEEKDESGELGQSSSLPRATDPHRSALDSASRHVADIFGSTSTGEMLSPRGPLVALKELDQRAFDSFGDYETSRPFHWIRQPRILLVEDDQTCRRIASKFLYSFNCLVEAAVDGRQAVNKVETSSAMEIDLIFMDPKLYSDVAAKQLFRRTQAATIIMSSNTGAEDISMFYGASDVLPKPFTKEGMFRQLERHLQHLTARKSTDPTSSSAAVVPRAQGPLDKLAPAFF